MNLLEELLACGRTLFPLASIDEAMRHKLLR
jgi:hypothetical protein